MSPFGKVQVPGSVAALLELRLGAKGHDALGYSIHVPHYLAQAEYPQAAVTALEAITRGTGLVFPMDALRDAADKTTTEIEEQIQASAELSGAIAGLEQQYDAFTAEQGQPAGRVDARCPPATSWPPSSRRSWRSATTGTHEHSG